MSDLTLGAEFPQTSREAWLELVDKTLKGADFDRALLSTTYDGITIAPLYSAADVSEEMSPPGSAPFTRGALASRTEDALPWHICQSISHPDPAKSNAEALHDLDRGVSALVLEISHSADSGISLRTPDDLTKLIEGVYLDLAPIHLSAGDDAPAIAALYLAHLRASDIRADAIEGNLGLDPIGALTRSGHSVQTAEQALKGLADTAAFVAAKYPNLRTASVDTSACHHAGASEAQEIAVALATGIAYLRAMETGGGEASGMDLEKAAAQIGFTMTADTEFFATIAKLRAARSLWAEATAACGIAPAAMELRIETAARMMARRDAWVNMLRTTVACFAAGIGGAQAVTVHPYTAALGLPDGFGRRIARNTQIILQEESSLGQVLDPAGGSGYVETLTQELADRAWQIFREIETEGGILQSLRSGTLQSRIAATAEQRAHDIAMRKAPITGVSEFPNLGEDEIDTQTIDPDAEQEKAAQRHAAFVDARTGTPDLSTLPQAGNGLTAALVNAAGNGATVDEIMTALGGAGENVTALAPHQLGEGFETLRDTSDAWLTDKGTRPRIFLANLGSAAVFTARASFARNFFEAGGIEAVTNTGFETPDEAAMAFRDSGAVVAVICSSDTVYGELAAETATALKHAGAAHVYLAGVPGDRREALEAAGVGTFIHSRCNVLETLSEAYDLIRAHSGGAA